MPTFKNVSEQVFQDGDLLVKPGESFSTEEEGRVEQMRVQYAWQFDEASGKAAKDVPTEAQVKAERPAADVRPMADGSHVEVDADGKQSKKIG
jgi:hypothetical protein